MSSKPFVSSFQGKIKINSAEFVHIFKKYDKDGNGFIEAHELDGFLQDLAKEHGSEIADEAAFKKFKDDILTKYDENTDNRIAMSELANILPSEENFLLEFRSEVNLTSVDFVRIWYHYDNDKSGYLETKELEGFLRDLLRTQDENVNPQRIDDYKTIILDKFDVNNDGKIELSEMSRILPVEENFLKQFTMRDSLNREEFESIFNHYDKDKNGEIEDSELIGLLRDVLERDGTNPTTTELESCRANIMKVCDMNKDGKLNRGELRMFLAKST